ncbi:Crp/Fnr family transcriptional regulator [uncultured Methylobacterium sp.]|uniref:Crp/Fnr family transcriptional regulator n=1 Tax=uncultured Methylobacterium sp. TaxID=157278 RepID=UPI0026167869|nr:Crp/Fnr family transcriptional regulator [uncultured Methylobacterium sp.]
MAPLSPHEARSLLRKVESIALFPLSDDERAALLAVPMQVAVIGPRQDIVRERDRPSRCFTLLEGFACCYKTTDAGLRQVMAYYVPGDVPDLQSLHLKVLDNSLATVTRCRIGFIQHDAMRALLRDHPRLVEVLWRLTLIDGAIVREWVLNIGRREAKARLAHLFCEMATRLKAVGLLEGRSCDLPMTQAELADALGLSTVHINRTLQDLRGTGRIVFQGGRLTVNDWDGLAADGEFDPCYLHLKQADAG